MFLKSVVFWDLRKGRARRTPGACFLSGASNEGRVALRAPDRDALAIFFPAGRGYQEMRSVFAACLRMLGYSAGHLLRLRSCSEEVVGKEKKNHKFLDD
ncbi:hypothetical protein TNIN_107221 [Trichonephila inaurata madagascariensis]|uniref:Uncharacterized protein n=1 Tax=Trichonephila inaurata madagascariensis TaxID=2747483 RepID=A0A8X6WYV2_9ARAC|nr:hypothetical protein TNIN_107221 [Trichonephila inaurata madagascariensis]